MNRPPPTSADLRLEGPRLYLRRVRPEDAQGPYLRWMNDPEVVRFLETRFHEHTAEGLREYIEKTNADPNKLFLAMVLKQADTHIGNIKLGPIDRPHRLGDIGLMIGEKQCWGEGYATEAIQVLTRYAFSALCLHKLTASCYANNLGSARAFEKAGFAREAVRPQHFFCGGKFVDALLFGLLNPAERTPRDQSP